MKGLRETAAALRAAGIKDAAFEASELCLAACGRDAYLDDTPLSEAEAARLRALTARRCAHEPLQYLCGEWDFLDLTLSVGPGVLIPRADTETVAEAAVRFARMRPSPAALDLCSGTGCLALSIAEHVPDARVTAVELFADAFVYLARNNARYGGKVRCVQADAFAWQDACAPESLDLITANPPYVTETEYAALAPELYFEPREALVAPQEGLAFYRHIAPAYFAALKPGGALFFEVGVSQHRAVAGICREAGYVDVRVLRDAEHRPRCVAAFKAV